MIVDKLIKVKINKKNINHYIKFYPDVKLKDIIDIDIEKHLLKGSNQKINVKCDICEISRLINFQSYNRNINSCPEYTIYTCDKCSHVKIKEYNKKKYGVDYYSQTDEYAERFKNTMLDKYGVEYALQSDELKQKQKNNNLLKYNVENVFQNECIKNRIKESNKLKYGYEYIQSIPDIREKMKDTLIRKYGLNYPLERNSIFREIAKNTMIKKYGVDIYSKSDDFLDKVVKTNLKKYGVEWVMQNNSFKDKSKLKLNEKYGVDNIAKYEKHRLKFKISSDSNYIKYMGDSISLFKCDKGHNFEIHFSIYNNRKRDKINLCTICYPVNDTSSIKEKELQQFISDNYSGIIVNGYRDKFEIDVYMPELKIGFEFNGIWWHSEFYKDKKYHFDKTIFFKNNGIEIIHIWEDDWINKCDLIKSMILNKIKRNNFKIGSRKCEISIISNKQCKDFLNLNHIQGWCISKYRYALIYNNEIVSVMTFGKLRKNLGQDNVKGSYELLRFCNKKYTSVNGSASKLLKYFINQISPENIISYSKNDYSSGMIYEILGFKNLGYTDLNYYWVVNNLRENRFKWRKDILVKMGGDINMSESQIMLSNGYYRIYDSGNTKWNLKL